MKYYNFNLPFIKNWGLVRDFNLKNPKDWATFFATGKTASGAVVNEETSLALSAVWACVRLTSQTVAQVPLKIYKRVEGGKEVATSHPLYKLLHEQFNNYQSSFIFREVGQQHVELRGNFYAYINKDNRERASHLTILNPDKVTPVLQDGQKFYKVEGEKDLIPNRLMLHICGPMSNGITGLSPIKAHRENLGLGLSAQKYGANFYGNGAHVNGILSTDATLTDDQRKNTKDSWSTYTGNDSSHKTAVLDGGLKYQRITIAPEEAQFLQSRKFQITEVARIFGVQPHLIADLERSTNNNIEHQSIEFVKYTILPRIKRWEAELNDKLLREDEKSEFVIEFNLDGLMRGDSKSRSEYYSKMLQNGVVSINEVRGLENLNTIDGGGKHRVQMNLIDINTPTDGE